MTRRKRKGKKEEKIQEGRTRARRKRNDKTEDEGQIMKRKGKKEEKWPIKDDKWQRRKRKGK